MSVCLLLLLHSLDLILCGNKQASGKVEEQSEQHYNAQRNPENIEHDSISVEGLNQYEYEYSSLPNIDLSYFEENFVNSDEDNNINTFAADDLHEDNFFTQMEAWIVERKLLPSGHNMYLLREYTDEGAAFFHFRSKKIYIIKRKENEIWSVILRIGWGTTPHDREAGQEFAMKVYSPLCDKNNVKVEFKRIVETPRRDLLIPPNVSPYTIFRTNDFPLYLLMGTDNNIRVEKVPPTLLWFDNKNDYCLVLDKGRFDVFVLSPTVYCSPSSSDVLRLEAKKLGLELLCLRGYSSAFPVNFITQRPLTQDRVLWNISWESLYRTLESGNGLSKSELNVINERLSSMTGENFVVQRDEATSLFKISNGFMQWDEIVERPLRFDILDDDGCFILDSASFGGIFVVLGKNTDLNTRIIAARKAENIVTNKYDLKTRITIIKHGEESVSLKVHFKNWTYNSIVAAFLMNPTSDEFIRDELN